MLASLMGVFVGLISFVEGLEEDILWIRTSTHKIVFFQDGLSSKEKFLFLISGPICAAMVASTDEAEFQMLSQLKFIHSQVHTSCLLVSCAHLRLFLF